MCVFFILFLSAVAAAVFVVMSWELISPSPETSLNERICIVGVFFCCCCYFGSGRGGGIKNLQDAEEKKKETILGVVSYAIQFSSRCIFVLVILLIVSLFSLFYP